MTEPVQAQRWDAGRYAATAGFVPAMAASLVDLLAPVPGERVLDLGCGDGVLSAEIARRGARVLGVDASPEMLAAAREKGLQVRLADGQALDLGEHFDAVFSNAALHWMQRPDAVLTGVRRHLVAGGRFVGEMGGHANVAAIRTAILAVLERRGIAARPLFPWYFPTAQAYRARLEAHGFEVVQITLQPRPTPLAAGMQAWLQTFAGAFLKALPPGDRPVFIGEVTELLRPALCDEDGNWLADYVRLRFVARALLAPGVEPGRGGGA